MFWIIIRIVSILGLYTQAITNFGIIAIAQTIVGIWLVFLGQQIVFLGGRITLFFCCGIWTWLVILIPASNCKTVKATTVLTIRRRHFPKVT